MGTITVTDLLREGGFSLQSGAPTIEGKERSDCDAQLRYTNERARQHMGAGQPVIGVDAKKKELVGDYENAGRQWQSAGEPVLVRTHDSWTGRDRARRSLTASMASPRTTAG
ncbi:ISAzo13-like element transposase-related protein [Streptomyces sp. MMBL 11-3]|uniref:ISAzo13-like element transposase-related protein n=1 Tax=Streptomyces sp. MMBL 11-3 TaxID=3382639 RepID=UPI0039B37609